MLSPDFFAAAFLLLVLASNFLAAFLSVLLSKALI